MQKNGKDLYFVAVKIFLTHRGRLFVAQDNFGDWDLPGGRIKADEFEKPLEKVIARKMTEELGPAFKYRLGKPVVFMRHERREAIPGRPLVRIFAVGYEARFLGGIIRLSARHLRCEWVPVTTFRPKKYFKGGWLKGVEEYAVSKKRKR